MNDTEPQSTTDQWLAFIARRKITFTVSTPIGEADKVAGADKAWPCIAYVVTVTCGERRDTFAYKLGVGHVDWQKAYAKLDRVYTMPRLDGKDEVMICAMMKHRTPIDSLGLAKTAAKVAMLQKVEPKPEDMLSALVSDGAPAFDAQSFEDWAGDFGYDLDSRAAEAIYNACVDTGRKLVRLIGRAAIDEARGLEGL